MHFVAPLVFAAAAGFSGSDRAALNLAIAGTRDCPPDLSAMIVRFRKEFLSGVRDAARRPAPADLDARVRGIPRAILARTPFSEVMGRIGEAVGALLSAGSPEGGGEAWEKASAGPFRYSGVTAAAIAGDPAGAVRAALGRKRDPASEPAETAASRLVSDETNLLWAIWIAAGGDARPAGKFDERNGPYVIPAGR